MRPTITSRARAIRKTTNPYSRWLITWLKCDEAPGALVLADSSGRGNDVSPNYAPVWRPNFVIGSNTDTGATRSFLKCMRPTGNTGILLEPTTTGTTGATEPNWNLTPGGTTTDNTVTWTTRTPTIAFSGTHGVVCGLGGSVCVPRSSYGVFSRVMGWMKTDDWEYTATTLSATTTGIHSSVAAAIPAGLGAGDILLPTGFATVDDQMFGVVAAGSTTTDIVISGGMLSADTNAGALPITLRRVYRPYSIAISARYTPLLSSASTHPGYCVKAATYFGTGSGGQFVAQAREDGSRRVQVNTWTPAAASQSVSNINLNLNQEYHIVWIWDRVNDIQCTYINGGNVATIAMDQKSRCVQRDVPDATYFTTRQFLLQFFAGSPIAAFKDVQVYAAPALVQGFSSNASFTDLVQRLDAGGGPLTAGEFP